jgi:hypothetical protein
MLYSWKEFSGAETVDALRILVGQSGLDFVKCVQDDSANRPPV